MSVPDPGADPRRSAGAAEPPPPTGLGGQEPAVSLERIGTFQPKTGTMDAWNAAYVRVEDYLRAHRIHNRLHQSRLIQALLERAARRHEADPTQSPTALAAAETEAMMQHWFAAVLGNHAESADRIAAEGRLAFLLADGPQKWPYAFLDDRATPPEFLAAMRAGAIEAGPDMAVSSMVPRPIDLGAVTEAAGETIERIESWPLLRTLLLWLLFAGCLAAIFKMTR